MAVKKAKKELILLSGCDYENPWTFDNRPFLSEHIGEYYGFIYLITNILTGEKYVGRKYFKSHRKLNGAKRRTTLESDWKKYYSSSSKIKADVKLYGKFNFKREILSLHKGRGDCNYTETKMLFNYNVLESKAYVNDNILGRYFRNSIDIDGRKLSKQIDW